MRLTSHDASFLYSESASGPMHTASIFVLEGELPFERVFSHFQARMHLIARYMQKLAFVPFNLAHPKWVDDPDFDLANHVVPHSVPEGSTLEEAVDLLLAVNEGLLDRNRPLWKTYVVDGVPGKTLMLQQVHHAMIDGVSGIQLTMVQFDFDRDAPDPPPGEPRQPATPPSAMDLVGEVVRESAERLSVNPLAGVHTDRKSFELLRNAGRAFSRFFTEPAITAPWNAGLVGPKRRLRWTSHPFSEFREIRRAFGGTINDVVLAMVSEGAARYLDRRREETEGKYLRIMCPVSVRTEDEAGSLGNRVSAIFPLLPAWSMDAAERLRAVIGETERIKRDEEAQALTFLSETMPSVPAVAMAPTLLVGTRFDPTTLAGLMPLPVVPNLGTRLPLYGFNFTCTNVPGVQVPQYLAGHEISNIIGILMLTGTLGYGMAVVSYNQNMRFNFVCEPRLMPDLDVMVEAVEQVYQELLEEARRVNEPPAPPSRGGRSEKASRKSYDSPAA
jgi:WS/DGAT/MGAT family acyltransferase